ncbi:MAG: transporter permease [Myxococcaceae bacterium]|nr:transporter permease [Myxococcaceae bacterium]
MIDALHEVYDSITRHRLRALATAFGVFWGIFMLTLLLASGRGLRNGIDSIFVDDAVNSVWIFGNRTVLPFEGMGVGRGIQLDADDLDAIIRSVPELVDVTPRRMLASPTTLSHGSRSATLPVFGIYPGYARIEKTKRTRGRLINELDLSRARKVVLLGQAARTQLFGQAEAVGQSVSIAGVEFSVIGEFTDDGGNEETQRVYIPYTALAQTFDASRRIEIVAARLRPDTKTSTVHSRLIRLLARRHRFHPRDDNAVGIWFAEQQYNKLQNLMRGIDLGILVVGLGTLLSGMIGVSNILFVSVRERAQEFGLRRALGATAHSILRLVLTEALVLATAAGALGLLVGLGLVALAQRAELRSDYFKDPGLNLETAAIALCILIVTALCAGFFPAREAARMQPIDALRRD